MPVLKTGSFADAEVGLDCEEPVEGVVEKAAVAEERHWFREPAAMD